MIDIKTPEQIKIMQHGGKILSDTLHAVCAAVKPGMSELEVDAMAEKLIRSAGGEPGFMKVPGWKYTVCVSTNEVVVHGIPTDYVLKEGDIIGIDCGVYYQGFHTDMSETVQIKSLSSRPTASDAGSGGILFTRDDIKDSSTTLGMTTQKVDAVDRFLSIGKKALEVGIKQARGGNHIGDISKVIQDIVEKEGGYSVVRSLIGHGVGRELHEEPEVPGYLDRPIEKTPLLKPGMTIAIEVIYNMGKSAVVYDRGDDWTISSKDGSLSGLFERTIAITDGAPLLLTP